MMTILCLEEHADQINDLNDIRVCGYVQNKYVDGKLNRRLFYIKRNYATARIFNPFKELVVSTLKRSMAKDEWEYVRVNEPSFDYYTKFVQTNNELYLTLAEREMKNGY